MIIVGTTLPLLLIITGMWDFYRWGMYFESMRSVAPIEFYGQVCDVEGESLQGAVVTIHIVKHNWAFILGGDTTTRYKQCKLVTDAKGRFEIAGESGVLINVKGITLPGYRFKPRLKNSGANWDTSFYFAGPGANPPHVPDRNNPVSFEMELIPALPPPSAMDRPPNRIRERQKRRAREAATAPASLPSD